jgi:hypothetical protein
LKWAETTSITETRKSGKEGQRGGGSTWYCEELALAYAMYLSPVPKVDTQTPPEGGVVTVE